MRPDTAGQGVDGGGSPGEIRVAIIEDVRAIREGLEFLIDGTPGFRSGGSFRTMEDALVAIERNPPHVALVDIGLPGMSGIEGIRRLRERCPEVTLLMLTIYDDDQRIFDALCAGACGYLLKKTPPARLLDSIREALAGGSPMSPEVARRVIEIFRAVRPPDSAAHDLTPHELRILKMLVDGHNYQTASEELGISVNTVAFHVKKIYAKLQVHSKSEAVSKALREHLLH